MVEVEENGLWLIWTSMIASMSRTYLGCSSSGHHHPHRCLTSTILKRGCSSYLNFLFLYLSQNYSDLQCGIINSAEGNQDDKEEEEGGSKWKGWSLMMLIRSLMLGSQPLFIWSPMMLVIKFCSKLNHPILSVLYHTDGISVHQTPRIDTDVLYHTAHRH